MGVQLFVAEQTNSFQRELRRFCWPSKGQDCPTEHDFVGHDGVRYPRSHDASVVIDAVIDGEPGTHGDLWPHDDPRWPAACERCGYVFAESDEWQLNEWHLYRNPQDGQLFVDHPSRPGRPVGACIRVEYADKFYGENSWKIILPDGGEWITTQEATGGGRWSVTGEIPNITVSPSIFHNAPHGWHGFIQNGQLNPA